MKKKERKKMQQFQFLQVFVLILITTEAIDYAKQGCNDACGFVKIPYPFGIGPNCAANKWYAVDCNSSRPYLSAFNNMEVLDVNLEQQKLIVNVSVISRCRNSIAIRDHIPGIDLGDSPFLFSGSDNMLNFFGCGYAGVLGDGPACSTCTNEERTGCQIIIDRNLKSYSLDVTDFKGVGGDGSCGSAFLGITPVVWDTIWRFGYEHLINVRNPSYYPISLLWFLTKDDVDHGLPNCWEPKSGESSLDVAHLIKCSCGDGRVGNPYLHDQCKDSTEALSLVKKGCQERCGEVGIPFPFGIGAHCALDEWYVVDCNLSIPYLSAFSNMEVLNVSLEQQTITVNVSMNSDCQNRILNSSQILPSTVDFEGRESPFLFSRLHNIFVAVGCGNAVITDVEGTTVTGCSTTCSNDTFIDIKNCYGLGCCQATVPYYLEQFTLNLTQLEKQGGNGTCGFAFLVDKDSFLGGNFSLQSVARDHYSVPISLYWPLTLIRERDEPAFDRPECTDRLFRLPNNVLVGHRKCQCNISQEGNPYLPNGCRELKECIECERKGGVCSRVFSNIYDDATSQIISKFSCDLDYGHKSSLGVILAFKIEDLVKPTADTQRKLELLYQIPNRERACLSETATSEASFSSDHTPDMSSAIPKPVGKFSLADIKNKITKKEKSEETVAAKPIHSPATRSRATGKKRKTVDPVILLDSFDGLSAMEVKDKMHALHSTMNLGFEQLHELLRIQEEELQRSREAYDDLKTISEQKDGYYRQKEENLLKEIEDNKVKAEKEREKVVDEAQESAATAVVESMFEMAKDAKAAGFSLPKWDLEGWAKILGRMDELVETDSQAAGVATAEGASVEEGAGRDVPVGDEGKDAQA